MPARPLIPPLAMSVALSDIPRRHSISVRIVTVSLLALVIALMMIGGTLWLSWQLEGGAAAINDAGSLRMRAYRVALVLQAPVLDEKRAIDEIRLLEQTLAALLRGDPTRPLVLPSEINIQKQYSQVRLHWDEKLHKLASSAALGDRAATRKFHEHVDGFVAEVDAMVSAIEHDNARKTGWLRLSQGVLIVIAIMGTVTMIYLLYLWIIRPVLSLQAGITKLAAQRFDARVPVETEDEFGALAKGFNAMAGELQTIYRDLEQRVHDKTAQLAAQNNELTMLYEMAAFLVLPNSVDAQCKGFLQRVMQRFEADGGSLRVQSPADPQLRLVVAEGVSSEVLRSEQCRKAHECLCGEAAANGLSILQDLRAKPRHALVPCTEAGFKRIAAFRISSPLAALGSFTLHFRSEYQLSAAEMKLLETLGQQLGSALENTRLMAHERLLAVSEERNLVAQGLHDSLAQSLNFLNLQVQMLDKALLREPHAEVELILPRLRVGLQESYNDVRELLANFRTRLDNMDVRQVLLGAVTRFQEQTGVAVGFEYTGDGASLPDEQKLQILFVLQEALSNVRKHAKTEYAWVKVSNEDDFCIEVGDHGCGFNCAAGDVRDVGVRRIGLHIMQERADRIGAELKLVSVAGEGTLISLILRAAARQAA